MSRFGKWFGFKGDPLARVGAAGIALLFAVALAAPLLANGRPWLLGTPEGWSVPAWRTFFAPDGNETLIEQIFNWLLIALPAAALTAWLLPRRFRAWGAVLAAAALIAPFVLTAPRMDKTDYRALAARPGNRAVFAPVPYGPYELVSEPFAPPTRRHWMGADESGRSLAARMIYGSRVSLAVGLGATLLALAIGTLVGLLAGYRGGWFDLAVMRLVEVMLCFPTFLLLLIVMSILNDCKFRQSIPVVIAVIGLTGWIGLTFLVRGEVLKQRVLPYIRSCEVTGVPVRRILLNHLLPNITGPILISFTFGVAGAVLAESGLSFLGFGVQPPTASWGALLRQAFDDPLAYWHLTFFPGLALFVVVSAFNFTGEGLRKILSPRE